MFRFGPDAKPNVIEKKNLKYNKMGRNQLTLRIILLDLFIILTIYFLEV